MLAIIATKGIQQRCFAKDIFVWYVVYFQQNETLIIFLLLYSFFLWQRWKTRSSGKQWSSYSLIAFFPSSKFFIFFWKPYKRIQNVNRMSQSILLKNEKQNRKDCSYLVTAFSFERKWILVLYNDDQVDD